MKLAKSLVPILFTLTLALPAQNPEPSRENSICGMVYGKAHSFTVCAPKGWTLDNGVLNDQGIYAAFYPEHSSWQRARDNASVMYVNTATKETNKDVATLMRMDAEDTRKQSPNVQISELEALKLKDGVARVQLFKNSAFGRSDAVAYVDSPKVIVMFVISARNEEAFQRDYPAFVQLAQSYVFLSSNVTVGRN